MTHRISRRTMLRGLLGASTVAVGLPTLECMLNSTGTAFADGDLLPRRFGVFFWGGGLPWTKRNDQEASDADVDIYTPERTGEGWEITELLTPLAAHKANINVITGYTTHVEIPGHQNDSHIQGQAIVMTGDRVSGDGWDHSQHLYKYNRPSIDKVIADDPRFYKDTRPAFRSLELGVSRVFFHDHSGWLAISHNGPGAPNSAIREPVELFKYLFPPSADVGREAAQRRLRVLDAVLEDAKAIEKRLGVSDRRRLEAHLDGLSSIQSRLQAGASACQAPTAVPPDFTYGNVDDGEKDNLDRLDLIMDMLVLALRCDMTRVFTMMFTNGGTNIRMNAAGEIMGQDSEHNHDALHRGSRGIAIASTKYHLTGFARFLDKLSRAEEVQGGSLLDSCCILGTSEYGSGFHHTKEEFPLILAGKCGGALRTGLHIRKERGNLSEAHVTILRALGLETPSFGWNGGETSEALPDALV